MIRIYIYICDMYIYICTYIYIYMSEKGGCVSRKIVHEHQIGQSCFWLRAEKTSMDPGSRSRTALVSVKKCGSKWGQAVVVG